ncbi:MAG: cytochrome c [Burkholderiaceae bacterium]|jgi:cytochrome c
MGARAFAALGGLIVLALTESCASQVHYGIGQPATAAQVASWDIDVAPDGRNLPPGRSSVAHGREVYLGQCSACHGAKGEGGVGDKLAGGQGSLASDNPLRTVGSYWPYATTLFDYIRRAMPLNAPESLSNEDVYAVSGYVLYLNGLLPEDAKVDAQTLTTLKMPNRDGFISDPRPDVKDAGCQNNCVK